MGGAEPDDGLDLLGAGAEGHRVRHLHGVVGGVLAVVLAHRPRRREPFAEQLAQRRDQRVVGLSVGGRNPILRRRLGHSLISLSRTATIADCPRHDANPGWVPVLQICPAAAISERPQVAPGSASLPCSGMPAMLWRRARSEEHTSELQSLMRLSYAVFCLNKK